MVLATFKMQYFMHSSNFLSFFEPMCKLRWFYCQGVDYEMIDLMARLDKNCNWSQRDSAINYT